MSIEYEIEGRAHSSYFGAFDVLQRMCRTKNRCCVRCCSIEDAEPYFGWTQIEPNVRFWDDTQSHQTSDFGAQSRHRILASIIGRQNVIEFLGTISSFADGARLIEPQAWMMRGQPKLVAIEADMAA